MHYGLVMECDYRYGSTLEDSFVDAFGMVDAAEAGGFGRCLAGRAPFRRSRKPLGLPGGRYPVLRLLSPDNGQRHRRPHPQVAGWRRGQRAAPGPSHSIGRGSRNRRPGKPGPVRLRRGAQRVSPGLRGVWRALRREQGAVPGVPGRDPERLDQRHLFPSRKVLPVRESLRTAQALPEALPAGAHCRHHQGKPSR